MGMSLESRVNELCNKVRRLEESRDAHIRLDDEYQQCVDARITALEAVAPKPAPKPAACPWCGSRSRVRGPSPRFWVECVESSCDASGPSQPSRLSAIAAWNKVAKRD